MSDSARFSQSHGIVPMVAPLALNYNTGVTMDSIDMSKYNHACLIIMGSADCAGTGVFTIPCATTIGGTTAVATFTYRYISVDVAAAALADVLSTPVTDVSTLTFVEATIVSGMYVIEWDAADLNVSGVQYRWATPAIDAAGTAGILSAVCILSEPRYMSDVMPTATV